MSGATWKITFFSAENDETLSYDGFYFMFNEDGTLMAHEGNRLTVGRWSESNNRFSILFDTNPLLLKLKGDWLITERTPTVLKLKDDQAASQRVLYLQRQ
jgi:hypothetical protein